MDYPTNKGFFRYRFGKTRIIRLYKICIQYQFCFGFTSFALGWVKTWKHITIHLGFVELYMFYLKHKTVDSAKSYVESCIKDRTEVK